MVTARYRFRFDDEDFTFVSIPERVLGWLQLDFQQVIRHFSIVSIPERVLGWLQLGRLAGSNVFLPIRFNP